MSNKDKLRALTVGAHKEFGKEVVEFDGEKFLIKQPTVKQRNMIFQAAKIASGDAEKIDLAKMQILATIYCVCTEDGEPIFTLEDYESLENQPCGGFIDEFSPVVMKLMNVEAEAKAKN
jgi:hypothetical protein